MAQDRLNYDAPFVSAQTTGRVVTDTGRGEYMRTLSNVFLTNAGEAHKRQLASDMELAKNEGARIGYDAGKDFKPMRPDSLFARQYNDSGTTMALENIQMDVNKATTDFYERNKMNPAGVAQSVKKYSEGYVGKLAPELQTTVKAHLDKIGASLTEKAKGNLDEFNRQVAAARFEQYDRDMENTLEIVAPDMFEPGEKGKKAQEAIAEMRSAYIATVSQHGPSANYQAGNYKVNGAGRGSGALSPGEVSDKLRAFDQKIVSAGVFGNYVKEAERGRGVDAYMNFVKGNVEVAAVGEDGKLVSMKVSDFLTNDEMAEIAGKMRQYSSGVDSMEDAVYKKWERGQKMTSDAVLRQGFDIAYQTEQLPDGSSRIIGGDPVALRNHIAQAINNPLVEPKAIEELQELAEKLGTGEIDDAMIASAARSMVAEGLVTSYKDLPANGLSDKTRIELHKQIDQRLSGEDWSTSVRYKQVQTFAQSVLAPARSAGFNIFGDDAATKQSAADMAEWTRRMTEAAWEAQESGTMPGNPNATPGKGQFDFVATGREIAKEIQERRNKPAEKSPQMVEVETQIKAVEDQMNNPPEGADVKAISEQYRQLQNRKSELQLMESLGQ